MPELPQPTTTDALRCIAALKREVSAIADHMNHVWQELDDLESRIEQQEELEAA